MTTYLVTGAAGFIGSHLCDRLLAAGDSVLGGTSLQHLSDEEEQAIREAIGGGRRAPAPASQQA
jgi:UDP-glucuronate 4-epimerase